MTLPAITLDNLNPAPSVSGSDLLLVRIGLQDFKATKDQVSNLAINSLSVASSLVQSDNTVISRVVGSGVQNFQTPVTNLGFLPGTVMWFRSATAPVGWSLLAGLGDRILAVSDGTNNANTYSNIGANGAPQGTWQQGDVSGIPGQGLNVLQIPNHQHFVRFGANPSSSQTANPRFVWGASQFFPNAALEYGTEASLGVVGGAGDIPSHDAFGACNPHNHGNNWRPLANVGILAQKQ